MKIKLVIFEATRVAKTVKVKPKQITGNSVRVKDATYILDPDRFALTAGREWGIPTTYATYYFAAGHVKPLPVPNFPKIGNNGVPREELNELFDPYLMHVWNKPKKDPLQELEFWVNMGAGLGVAYLIYVFSGVQKAVGA
jgi:hypothetical protein